MECPWVVSAGDRASNNPVEHKPDIAGHVEPSVPRTFLPQIYLSCRCSKWRKETLLVTVMASSWSLQPHLAHVAHVAHVALFGALQEGQKPLRFGKMLIPSTRRCVLRLYLELISCGFHGAFCTTITGVLRLQRQYGWEWNWSFNVRSQAGPTVATQGNQRRACHLIHVQHIIYLLLTVFACLQLFIHLRTSPCQPGSGRLIPSNTVVFYIFLLKNFRWSCNHMQPPSGKKSDCSEVISLPASFY